MNFEELNRLSFEEINNKPSSAWLVSLSDLVCLVLTFFVMMYASRDISESKIMDIRDSFVSYLGGEDVVVISVPIQKQGDLKQAKSEALAYIENMLISILKDYKNLNIFYVNYGNEIVIWTEDDALPKNLSKTYDERFFIISKIVNSISNQVEVSANSPDSKDELKLIDFAMIKLKELGYNKNILITLPQSKKITENLEKDKNKIKIQIIIKYYESVY